jgi:carbon-monoxide dehydrogenase large subunit
MDYLLPTAWETPGFELHEVVTPCPHHPIGPRASASARPSAARPRSSTRSWTLSRTPGVRNIDMPLLPDRVYEALTERHDVSGAPPVRMDD